MKILKMFFALLMMAAVFVSCKKDDPAPVVTGKWEGKFGELTETPTYHYGFVVKPGGELVRINHEGLVQGVGTWELNGTEFKGTFLIGSQNYRFSIGGEYNAATGKITGTWGMGTNVVNGGQFYLIKK